MRGELNVDVLNSVEASTIINLYQIFYLSEGHYKLVTCFNETPDEFDVQALLAVFS